MALKITGDKLSDTFAFDGEHAPTDKAMGGTELMMKWLRQTIDPDLINQFQIIPSRVRELEDKPRILWMHDTADDPEVQHLKDKESLDRFDKIVYVSHWQKQQFEWFLGIPPSKGIVLKNAIQPFPEHKKPDRGLNVLYSVFDHLCESHDNIHLDVYSSFKIYGWDHRDLDYKSVFDLLDKHPHITNHGAVSNDKVRVALQKAHIFAYPSIWPETSCISLMEAMSARLLCAIPGFAALPETAANHAFMYPWDENLEVHASMFAGTLDQAIKNYRDENIQFGLDLQKQYADRFYNIDVRAQEWTGLLTGILARKDQNALSTE